MLDKTILLEIVKKSTTNAVKYVHLETNMPVPDCKEYVANFKIENGIDVPSGTITWFKCDVVKPPIQQSRLGNQESVRVLIYREGNSICEANYIPFIECWTHGHGNWQPTHWAFINLPE
jgi:hypothetical protein